MVPQGGGGSLTGSASAVNIIHEGPSSFAYLRWMLWYLNGLQQRRRSAMNRTDQGLTRVREFIEKQAVSLDGRIPPERTLASALGVGRRSVRRALDMLEQEGRIHRHQGRGTVMDTRQAV